MSCPRVVLRPKRAQPFFGRHPWVYPGAIQTVEGSPADGAEVELHSSAGNLVARGFYNSKSKIRVRLYSWSADEPLDETFFRTRFASAIRFRESIFDKIDQPTARRLVSSESDGLSGLIVEQYDRWLVMQFTSLALAQRREMLAALLADLVQPSGIFLRTERGIGQLEGLELHDGSLWGNVPEEPIEIYEGPIRYLVDMRAGQKTGFYLDQRANRQVVARYLAGKEVLDCFCYTGGFGLQAAAAGATKVESVDVSEPALRLARMNAECNKLTNISFQRADVFDHLAALVECNRRFGGIVLDPPKFARNRAAVSDALRGYRVLLGQALRLFHSDGILVMCCCSGLINADDIEGILAQAAVQANRAVQILERRGQDVDHPISVTCPETGYLKCLICRVE